VRQLVLVVMEHDHGFSDHYLDEASAWFETLMSLTGASLVINHVERLKCYIVDRSGGAGWQVLLSSTPYLQAGLPYRAPAFSLVRFQEPSSEPQANPWDSLLGYW
jgi:hypothetical protein